MSLLVRFSASDWAHLEAQLPIRDAGQDRPPLPSLQTDPPTQLEAVLAGNHRGSPKCNFKALKHHQRVNSFRVTGRERRRSIT